ncbi:Uncharacterized conserved protein YecE, DUF72 family [Tistlia consotensis]|uniref:Uncharacterized conserved protein YecE, DUF72 family n=1 Tax=Tistlia consotensis USBA 355 TaxID=560819 RepID=A0A1Y6BNQ1_9PROT|nr:DUF72 domain-containing protein [Tistlia consotensis]SMF13063.1 Uncharacterized conserved protein YecE, DUF72 family [Tistlia consotensis USBA 355]SNR50746.1 Uncharacterized conserved protein YecE, DUF72 family [Tistlia consotensis]
MAAGTGALHIGTSGWSYPEWRGRFYPEGTRAADFLARYVERFDTVEVDNTFYRLPAPEAVAQWRNTAPPGFRFALKAHRYITHNKKLKDPEATLGSFLPLVAPLGDRLGPILFQLPPRWRRDDGRLAAFLAALPCRHRYAIEFRDESWLAAPVRALLERHGVACCQSDIAGRPREMLTADFTYLRLHGPDPAAPYRGRYDGRRLAGWARRIARWRRRGLEVFCYFDNTAEADAPGDARRLLAMAQRC